MLNLLMQEPMDVIKTDLLKFKMEHMHQLQAICTQYNEYNFERGMWMFIPFTIFLILSIIMWIASYKNSWDESRVFPAVIFSTLTVALTIAIMANTLDPWTTSDVINVIRLP